VPLAATLNLRLRSRVESATSDNVLAVLPGRERPDETVVFSAHWDHLGTDPTLPGDRIYNGAVDNADGVAGLLAIAQAFVREDPHPARSVVFFAPTLEESGLLGSRYYVAHPPFALAGTAADINMDALPLIGRSRDMSVIGLGQSELDDLLADALATQDRSIAPEAAPEKGHYFRSDHFSFARRGVPALYAKGGTDLRDGGISAGRSAEDDYARHRYHTPADEFRAELPLDGAVEDLAALYAVGRRLADGSDWPRFRDDSEFRAAQRSLGH
jgi:Zn-dependent M28 family amino/carboxypeptidase